MKIKRSIEIPDRNDALSAGIWNYVHFENFWVKGAERKVTFKNVHKSFVDNIYTGNIIVAMNKTFIDLFRAKAAIDSTRFENKILYNESKDVYMLIVKVASDNREVVNQRLSNITEFVGKL